MPDTPRKTATARIDVEILEDIARMEFERRPGVPDRSWKPTPAADYLREAWELRKLVLDPENKGLCQKCRKLLSIKSAVAELSEPDIIAVNQDNSGPTTGASSVIQQTSIEALAEAIARTLLTKMENDGGPSCRVRITDYAATTADQLRAVDELRSKIADAKRVSPGTRKTGARVGKRGA